MGVVCGRSQGEAGDVEDAVCQGYGRKRHGAQVAHLQQQHHHHHEEGAGHGGGMAGVRGAGEGRLCGGQGCGVCKGQAWPGAGVGAAFSWQRTPSWGHAPPGSHGRMHAGRGVEARGRGMQAAVCATPSPPAWPGAACVCARECGVGACMPAIACASVHARACVHV